MSDDLNNLKEYVAFIIREAFRSSRADISVEDQNRWKIVLYIYSHNIIPDTLSGYEVLLMTSYMERIFDILVPPDHLEDKHVRKFLKELHDLQDCICISSKPWEGD